jgi:hypothetical protein
MSSVDSSATVSEATTDSATEGSVESASSESATAVLTDSSTIDFSEDLDVIVTRLETLDSKMEVVESAAGTVLTYGVFYVPLLVLVLSLWWFFRNFLNRYY